MPCCVLDQSGQQCGAGVLLLEGKLGGLFEAADMDHNGRLTFGEFLFAACTAHKIKGEALASRSQLVGHATHHA